MPYSEYFTNTTVATIMVGGNGTVSRVFLETSLDRNLQLVFQRLLWDEDTYFTSVSGDLHMDKNWSPVLATQYICKQITT